MISLARKRAAHVTGFVLLLYWVLFGGTFAGALSWRHQFASHLLLFGASAYGGWRLFRSRPPVRLRLPPGALAVPVGLILLDKTWRALIGQSWNSTEDLAASASLLIAFLLLLNVMDDEAAIVAGCVWAAVAAAILGLLLSYFQPNRELALPLGSRVLMAGLLTLALPPAVARVRELQDQRRMRILWSAAAAILIIGIVQTRSAAAIALLPVLLLGASVLGLKQGRTIALSITFAAAASVCVYWLAERSEPLSRMRSIAREGADWNWENRLRYWSGAMPAIAQKWVVGWGAGSVGVRYPPFRIQRPGYAPAGEVVADLHDVPLHWLFEYGVAGLALRLAAFAGLLWAGFRGKSMPQKAGALALLGFGVFSLVHYHLHNPATCVIATLIVLLAVARVEPLELSPRAAGVTGLVLLGCALAIFSYQARLDAANYLLDRSRPEAGRKAVDSILRAALLDGRGGYYDAVAALRIDHLLESAPKDGPESAFLFDAADRHYRAALERMPWAFQILAARGSLLLRTGRTCDAIDPLEKAASLDFYFNLAHFNLANAYAACGAADRAADEAAIAILTAPVTVYASAWRANPEFLTRALDRGLEWAGGWNARSWPGQREPLSRLESFLRKVRSAPLQGRRQVGITLAENVAGQLMSDPFAYMFQRRTPGFQPTRIEVDGLDTGTWTPEGIGHINGLAPLAYERIHEAYRERKLDALMRSLQPAAQGVARR